MSLRYSDLNWSTVLGRQVELQGARGRRPGLDQAGELRTRELQVHGLEQAVQLPHAPEAAYRHLVKPRREGERPVLRQVACVPRGADAGAMGLRLSD